MSNELISLSDLGVKPLEENTQLSSLTKTSDYLPQIRVYGSSNKIVKEGKFPMGHFGLYITADNIIDMGSQFDCMIIAARPRAGNVMGDSPISFYDMNSPEFKDLQLMAMNGEQGFLAGLEYLLWLPELGRFALFFFGNKTLRRESEKAKALIGKGATCKVKLIKTTKYTWHGADIFVCDTPFSLPDIEAAKREVEKFNNPPASQVELADEDSRDR